MRSETRAFLFIAFPLVASGEEQPRLIGFVPYRMNTQRIVGEAEDFLFMLIEPCNPPFERDFVPLPVAVGNVDLQPILSTFSEFFADAEFEQRPSDVIRLGIDELGHGIRTAAMI